MFVSIIIVSWNTRDLLRKCLRSLYQYTRGVSFEIFVIDNASGDNTVPMVKNEFPQVYLIANAINKGFAGANNQGIRESKGDYILLLNPDTEFIEDSITVMANFLKRNTSCGIAGCHLINSDRSHQNSVRRFPKLLDQAFILLKLPHIFSHASLMQRYLYSDLDYTRSQMVPQIMGAFFMVKREVFDKIGYLDEKNFFNWFEEVDFCLRGRRAGFETWYCPDTDVIHHFGQSFKQVWPVKKQKMWNTSLRNYFLKNHTYPEYFIIYFLSWVSLSISYGIQSIKLKSQISKVKTTT